jgi:hypothetical protein
MSTPLCVTNIASFSVAAGVTDVTAATGAAYGLDPSGARSLTMIVTGAAADTVGIQISLDRGVTWTAAIRPIIATTGALAGASSNNSGVYLYDPLPPCNGLRVVKTGTANPVVVQLAFRNV